MKGSDISKCCYDHSLMVCDTILVRWIGTVSKPTVSTLKMHAAASNEILVMNKWTSLC